MKKIPSLLLVILVFSFFSLFYFQPSKAQNSTAELPSEQSENKLEKAKQISLEILNQQSLSRNVGTVDDLTVKKVEIDDLQMAHTRVQQTIDGIPVWEGEAIVHLKADGSLSAVTDDLKESIAVNTEPSISSDEAVRIADGLYKGAAKATEQPKVTMWIYRGKDRDHLTYRIETLRIDGSQDTAIPVDFIDAQTSERVFGYDNLQTATGASLYSGTVTIGTNRVGSTYYMENLTRKVGTLNFNYGTTTSNALDFTDTDDIWNSPEQRAAVDAQYGAEATMNYYQNVHNRNGIDGNGGPAAQTATGNSSIGLITSLVHYGSSGEDSNNAHWDPNGLYMFYGDGDGSMFSPLVTLDICGHEITHGVTQYEANLTYSNESGALNESMSDVFGAMVERYTKGENANTWKIGEDAYTPGMSGDAMRYMNNPHLATNNNFTANDDPDHYTERYTGSLDDGGVHINPASLITLFILSHKAERTILAV